MLLNKIYRKIIRFLLRPFIRKSIFDYSKNKPLILLNRTYLNKTEVNNFIFEALNQEKSFMISRFGYTELDTLIRYENFSRMNQIEKIFHWAETLKYPFSENCILNDIDKLSGFFPVNKETLNLFKREVINSLKEIDLLGSWVKGENRFKNYLKKAKVCELSFLEPYFSVNPWSLALENKKVLVIHPFSEIIKSQFQTHREHIFKNKNVLPKFQLKTLKPPMTYPGGDLRNLDWFKILDKLTKDALNIDFEIAIIGCGSYGMPLSARLKRAGKKTIHLGGSTQILFGIKGKRWDNRDTFRNLFNDYWVYPSSQKVYIDVEDGCYW